MSLLEKLLRRLGSALNPNPAEEKQAKGGAEGRYRRASESAFSALGLLVIGGLIALVFGASRSRDEASVIVASVMLAGASTLVGALLGFLFGIPRTLQGEVIEIQPSDTPTGSRNNHPNVGYRANTNLEQISDWLTKILVGVGLTQLTEIPTALSALAEEFSPGLGDSKSAQLIAGSLIVYFAVSGFLMAYLWTRLHLPSALRFADLDAIGALQEKLEENTRSISELAKQAERDALALSYVERQLSPEMAEGTRLNQSALNAAIAGASPSTKITIFYRAHDLRRDTWLEDKSWMERIIPIFRALIAADSEEKFHRNYAQLGYALKDRASPDYLQAITEISSAIRIRDKEGQLGFALYEANRALCRIKLFDQLAADTGADQLDRLILADMSAAAKSRLGRQMMKDVPEFGPWLEKLEEDTSNEDPSNT